MPEIGDDDGILRVEACGLCGTDHEFYTGDFAATWPYGFVPGHETVGVVEALGPAAAEQWNVAVGDRVVVANRRACRTCDRCRAGMLAACRTYGTASGSYGMVTADVAPSLWGGYATHHYLAPGSVLHPVPANLGPVEATLFNPLGAGIAWAIELPETQPGDVVCVLGPGIRGLACAVAAKSAGASFVMVTGLGARDASRLEAARRLGVDLAVDVSEQDPVTALREATGGLADVVVDVTARAPQAFAQAIELAGRGGRVVVAGARGGRVTIEFEPDLIAARALRLLGASSVSTSAQRRAIDLVASGAFDANSVTRRTAGFDDIGELLLLMAGERDEIPPIHAVFVPDAA